MPDHGVEQIRNVVLLSHSGAGKTSLSEAMLFAAGAVTRLGRVDEGSTTSDYDPDEVKRKISINLSLLPCSWKGSKINLIDTPGYPDFMGEVKAAVRVAEGAVIVVCAASGVEVGTEQAWAYTEEARLPRLILINKMDRENADFRRTLDEIRAKLGSRCIPVQVPIGSQADFQGIADLVTGKAYLGAQGKEGEVPSSLQGEVDSLREMVVEAVAEIDDDLMAKYVDGAEITQEEIGRTLVEGTRRGQIVPLLSGSALQNVGVRHLLDALVSYLPSPKESLLAGLEEGLSPDPKGPLSALVFKTSADPYVGKLTYFRVYSGAISSNSQVWNASRNGAERIGQLFVLRGKNQEPVAELAAGDIGAVAKLTLTGTGDALSTKEHPVKFPAIGFPSPTLSMAVFPKTKADLDKMGAVLSRLVEEDPTLRVHKEGDTGETVLSGLGEAHLEAAVEKMGRKFGVGMQLEVPRVPYKETITTSVKVDYRHKKQTGGHGQFAHVYLQMEPLSRGTGVEFENRVVGGAISRSYIPSVEKGVREAAQDGVLAHFPVTDIKATVYDGKEHPVDSSDICFKIAGAQAFKAGLDEGHSVLLEPVMKIQVTVPNDFTGDTIGDLNTKRARVLGMTPEGEVTVIEALVPQAEVMRYAIDLRSLTQGRGSFTMEFSHLEGVPQNLAQKIIAGRAAGKA
ncbi:MAG: elongation factor G [Dehalococcoidia bacterium]